MPRKKSQMKEKKMQSDVTMNAEELSIFDVVSAVKETQKTQREQYAVEQNAKDTQSSAVIIGDENEITNWEDLKTPSAQARSWYVLKNDLSKWTNRDYLIYFRNRYEQKFGIQYVISKPAGCTIMAGVQEKLTSALHRDATPTIMKQYLDWFFDHVADGLYNRYSCIKMVWLKNEINTGMYARIMKSSSAVVEEVPQFETEDLGSDYSAEAMSKSLVTNPMNFVLKYGLVLPVAYLVRCKKMTEKAAVDFLKRTVMKLLALDAKNFDILRRATETIKKYPDVCFFAAMEQGLGELSKDSSFDFGSIKISYSNHANQIKQFVFLKEG